MFCLAAAWAATDYANYGLSYATTRRSSDTPNPDQRGKGFSDTFIPSKLETVLTSHFGNTSTLDDVFRVSSLRGFTSYADLAIFKQSCDASTQGSYFICDSTGTFGILNEAVALSDTFYYNVLVETLALFIR